MMRHALLACAAVAFFVGRAVDQWADMHDAFVVVPAAAEQPLLS